MKWLPFCGWHFHIDFFVWKLWYFKQISLKLIKSGTINKRPTLIQIMAWCRTSDKPLSELMMPYFTGAFTHHYSGRSGEILFAILSCFHDFFPCFTPLNIRNHYDKTLTLFDTSWWRCYYDVYWLGGMFSLTTTANALRWRHNGRDGVSNRQPHDCLLNRLFMRRSKKTSKLRVTGLCAGNSPVTGDFPAQMASNAEIFFHLMTSS